MSGENDGYVASRLEVTALDGENLADSTMAKLEVTAQTQVVIALSDMVLAFMESLGGRVTGAHDADGNPIDLGPTIIDPLADAGEPPAAE